MHPVLLDLGFIKIHTYGAMAALGFFLAISYIRFQSKYEGLDSDKMMDLAYKVILAAIVGSRALFILTNLDHFSKHPLDMIKIWEGGLVFLGGVLACIPLCWYYLKKWRLSFWKVMDVFAPGLSIGHAIGRIGCLSAGCCYGRPAPEGAWYALFFPKEAGGLAPYDQGLYPTQLMESGAEVLIFSFLVFFLRKRKEFDGQIFLGYLILYSIVRSVIEVFRGDIERKFVIPDLLSTSQFISAILFLGASFGIVWLWKKRKRG